MTDSPDDPRPQPAKGVRERFPELIREFRNIARRMLRRLPAPSVAVDELVSEAYLRLLREEARRLQDSRSDLGSKPDAVLKACFGVACRDVMSVRWHKRQRRKEIVLPLDAEGKGLSQFELADIDEMLSVLAVGKPETAKVVELRVFGDLTVAECAELMGLSPRTVDRHWSMGRVWIKKELMGRARPGTAGD